MIDKIDEGYSMIDVNGRARVIIKDSGGKQENKRGRQVFIEI